MPSYSFSPFGNAQFLDANGDLAIGYKLFTYLAGSTTKEAVFSDTAGTPQTNPIILNSIGRPASPIFLDYAKSYKFVVAPPTDTDPPTSPVYTANNVTAKVPDATVLNMVTINAPIINLGTINNSTLVNAVVSAEPTAALGVANKGYVDRKVTGVLFGNWTT